MLRLPVVRRAAAWLDCHEAWAPALALALVLNVFKLDARPSGWVVVAFLLWGSVRGWPGPTLLATLAALSQAVIGTDLEGLNLQRADRSKRNLQSGPQAPFPAAGFHILLSIGAGTYLGTYPPSFLAWLGGSWTIFTGLVALDGLPVSAPGQ